MDLDFTNETYMDSECVRALQDLMQSGALNGSLEASNISCGNTSTLLIPERVGQGEDHTLRILLYSLIFFSSVFGNLLIIVVLTFNKRMRTVTNTFLLSLAMSDLMMAIFCMPFNLIPSILKDFIFGALMCKIVAYLMGTSVSISTFNLVAIAIERYSAICKPLKSRAWQTRSHAYRVIAATWVLAFIIMIPYPIISHLRPFKRPDNTTAHQCRHKWPLATAEQTWYVLLLLVLFAIPGVVMIVAYGLISRELYRGIQFETGLKKDSTDVKNGLTSSLSSNPDDGDGCYVNEVKRQRSMEMSTMSTSTQSMKIDRPRSNASGAKLEAKKRVIRMLVVIVFLFFLCWMPLYCVNTWRAFDNATAESTLSGTPIAFIHLLSYTSACVNPIIYCFMNTRFRKALFGTFSCCFAPCCHHCRRREPRENEEDVMATGASMSRFSYTIVSTMGTC
ncbi:cholecystokinin receptor-like isoform X2 [Cyprinodon tularosa]|uniref:Gastrin/cholecystokinin type B receptor n=1 Tax=Cyprinodon variegatus TaxID=28743 RepID=A0A3Q2G1Z8_CYPVA|nr:PREDICTED: cholecystokinin receptor-like isoform X2 [Cyprinodon variegatus]XP_038163957.1 cholecystokinin receptor-like isoform X2 [Cyprinodon tularosa]